MFASLGRILDGLNNTEFSIYDFDRRKCIGTRVHGNYLVNNQEEFINLFLYIDSIDDDGTINVGSISLFSSANEQKDYTKNQSRYTVLKKERIDLLTGEKKVLYVNKNYKE